ncbi:hypothetical protein KAI58_02710 [Candidatus Gracilibacteria bacterium]|nr:hypothetical protein [Candidatus Gracilibacteria bacterium]
MKKTNMKIGILVFLGLLIVWGIFPVSISAFALQAGIEKFLQKGVYGECISLDSSLILYEGLELVYTEKDGVDHFHNPVQLHFLAFWIEEVASVESREENENFFLFKKYGANESLLELYAKKMGIEGMSPKGLSEWFFWQ